MGAKDVLSSLDIPDIQILELLWIKVVYLSRNIQNVLDPMKRASVELNRVRAQQLKEEWMIHFDHLPQLFELLKVWGIPLGALRSGGAKLIVNLITFVSEQDYTCQLIEMAWPSLSH